LQTLPVTLMKVFIRVRYTPMLLPFIYTVLGTYVTFVQTT